MCRSGALDNDARYLGLRKAAAALLRPQCSARKRSTQGTCAYEPVVQRYRARCGWSPRAGARQRVPGGAIGFHTVGDGEPLLIVGGALCSAESYLPLAQMLSTHFTVHVIDRRGRGTSGPQGPNYSIDRESEDVLAVQAGATPPPWE